MSETAERFRRVAAAFSERVGAVPQDRWESPAPCDGWVARDVVAHLAEWLPAFFLEQWGVEHDPIPSPDDDPVGAWRAVADGIQRGLDDPAVADAERDTPLGRQSFAQCVDQIAMPDVLVHTWDLARATGLDEKLDAEEVDRLAAALLDFPPEVEQSMRSSGHYGPRVELPADASAQDRVLAFVGRQP